MRSRHRRRKQGGRSRGRSYIGLVGISYEGQKRICSHLGIEEARVLLDDRNSAIEGLQSVKLALLAHNSGQIETELLRMHVGLESEWQRLLLASRNLDGVLLGGEVAHDAGTLRIKVWCPKTSADELHRHWFRLLVGEGDHGIGGLAIDELDAEDLSIGEGGRDTNGECWALGRVLDIFSIGLYRGVSIARVPTGGNCGHLPLLDRRLQRFVVRRREERGPGSDP